MSTTPDTPNAGSAPNAGSNKLAVALGNARKHNPEGKNPTYRAGTYRLTLAADDSANPGYIYIKNSSYQYLGKISPAGHIYSSSILPITRDYLHKAIDNPEEVAMQQGKATGICCCCGRTLTNPLSIELGIGPICRGYFFPPEGQQVTPDLVDTALLDDLMDSPLPVPAPAVVPTEQKEELLEIDDLVDAFKRMTHQQQVLFFGKVGAYLTCVNSINQTIKGLD